MLLREAFAIERVVNVGIAGFGYWGPNLVRNFTASPSARVLAICDSREERAAQAARLYPSARATTNFSDLLADPAIDLIALATPVSTHFSLGMKVLAAGKHLLVEKPLAGSAADALALVQRARELGLHLFVDHTFIFTPAVRKIKSLLQAGELGSLLYYDSTRINLGLFQHDVDVIWDLMPHDLSILDFLLDGKIPELISCWGVNHFSDFADLAYVTLTYDNHFIAHVHVNWLAPVKIRQVLLCGDNKMVVYDEVTVHEKIRIYDRGVKVRTEEAAYERLIQYREGDMIAPKMDNAEALALEVDNIIATILGNEKAIVDGNLGYRVTLLLEAASASLRDGGRPVVLKEFMATSGAGLLSTQGLATS